MYDVPAKNGWTVFQANVMYGHGFPRCRVGEHCNDRDIFDKMDDVQEWNNSFRMSREPIAQ